MDHMRSDDASTHTHINPKTRTNASCAPQPLQANSVANKSWLVNYVEAALPRHIINALTSTQAAPGEKTHTIMQKYTRTDTHKAENKHRHTHTVRSFSQLPPLKAPGQASTLLRDRNSRTFVLSSFDTFYSAVAISKCHYQHLTVPFLCEITARF